MIKFGYFTHPEFLLPLRGHEPLLGLLAGRLGAKGHHLSPHCKSGVGKLEMSYTKL